jgi:drug/metabolite transporter (DMT)-like permease
MRPIDHARLLLLAALWGASFLFMRIAAPALGGMFTASVRVVLGVVSLAIFLRLMGVRLRLGKHLGATLLLGIVNTGVPVLMYALAARSLPAGYSAILNATTPLMGVVIGGAFFAERIDARKMLGIALGITGVVALTAAGPIEVTPAIVLGTAGCLVATSCYGASGFLTRRWIAERGGLDPRLVAFGSLVGASLFLLPFLVGSMAHSPSLFGAVVATPALLLALFALGVGCTAWGSILYFRLVNDIGPIRCLTVTFLIPPFGILWGAIVLHEQVTWAHLLGSALIGVALFFVLRPAGHVSKVAATAQRNAS